VAWKPRRRDQLDPQLRLTAEEGFVLSCLDGATDVDELPAVTSLPADRIAATLEKLRAVGAIDGDAAVPVSAPPVSAPVVSVPAGAGDEELLELIDEGPVDPNDLVPEAEPPPEEEEAAEEVAGEPGYRKLFEQEIHPLAVDLRVAMARTESGAKLLALCFDPDPRVVHAILANANAGLDHARLIAANHHNPAGLEALTNRAEIARDREVVRRLLRNVQTSDTQLRRVLEPRPMREIFVVGTSRDVAERTRLRAREILHGKFMRADPQERFDLVWSTDGRVLPLLPNAAFDARTTQMFCARTFTSVLLIQNLAKFRACPPMLLTHMLKQPLVRRQPGLRKMVLAHPNVPSEVRRRGGF